MTPVAAKVLADFEGLAPEEQLIIRERVISVTAIFQREALDRLRGAGSGKDLLKKLLRDRATEDRSGRANG